ncbi:MAG: hypothetical protein C0623_07520 [Desulfuromonas sp.]|nr:MAG: hypothetical protein C0623_07520 [Desulfuromonas sp.]
MHHIFEIVLTCWRLLQEAAPYVLFGFVAAGLLRGFLLDNFIARHIGRNSFGSVLKASLLGIPLPLCSCGVIPAAVELRKQGASKGGSAAFLVSTPESGVDSIAITYALLDPVMTLLRPVAAFLTATSVGLAINRLPDETNETAVVNDPGCGCPDVELSRPQGFFGRLGGGLSYAFGELLKDIGGWLLFGIVIAGLLSYLLPENFFAIFSGNEFLSLLVMLVVGIPIYICASASTPVAAALILKGLSPGAALVFLLAGPATNAATIAIVGRFWGRKATVVYLAAIAFCSLLFGWATNRLYAFAGWDILGSIQLVDEHQPSLLSALSAVVLLLLILRHYIPHRLRSARFRKNKADT